jgi:hypothetical protein
MLVSKSIDLLVVAFDGVDELLQQTRPCHDSSSTRRNDCRASVVAGVAFRI